MRVFLFGSGINAKKIIELLNEDIKIIGFIDNNPEKWNTFFENYKVYSSDTLLYENYDYIVISIMNGYENIYKQLIEMGISNERIIIPFSFDRNKYEICRKIFNMEKYVTMEMETKFEKIQYELENAKYELAEEIIAQKPKMPNIKGFNDTVKKILYEKKSISRYGDGEFDLILGINNSFQRNDNLLAERLKEILRSNLDNHIVAIPDVYGALKNRTQEFKDCFRKHLSNGAREQEYALLDMQKTYYDAFISRPYKDYVDKSESKYRFDKLKDIWKNRDITIVEGHKTRMGVGNDLFKDVRSCNRILCPIMNAYDCYNEILEKIKSVSKDRLILIALGATATVLAYDLSLEGYQAIDIGHIDIEYEWYLRGVSTAVAIEGKYTNEAPGGRIVNDNIIDDIYKKQIVGVVG